jgi:acetoin:2,6-dichlorophenolindophenol oxidoreductase subunit alpha
MIDRDVLIRIYEQAAFARMLDERVQEVFTSGAEPIGWFPWRGSELLGATTGVALRPEDYLVTYYRDAVTPLAKGADADQMCAEVMGKRTGVHKGKSGWVHMIDPAANVVMNSGIVGGHLPVAAGWALSSQIRGDSRVTLCTFGDGGANEGAFHEALTLAALWKLPIVYVAHNNLYSEHTAFKTTSPVEHLADRARGYDIPGVTVDGGDVPALWDVLTTAIDLARSGGGPTLVEAMTYRFLGHARFDGMEYLPQEELRAYRDADPLPRFRAWLLSEGQATAGELADIDAAQRARVEQAWKFAQDSPYPDPGELLTDVYAQA